MSHRIHALLFLFIAIAVTGFADDQTVVISKPPAVCTQFSGIADLSMAQAAQLIGSVLGPGEPRPGRSYMIHAVRYNPDLTVEQQHWYVYSTEWAGDPSLWNQIEDPRLGKHFKENRIFGNSDVAVIYVQSNIPAVSLEAARQAGIAQLQSQGVVLATAQQQINALIDGKLIGGDPGASNLTLVDASSGDTLIALGGWGVPSQLDGITYKVSVVKKIPAPVQNLNSIIGVVAHGGASTIRVQTQPTALCGGQPFQVVALPADITVTALVGRGSKQTELGKNTFDDEKKYHYDFSFAFPLKSFNDLTVNSTDQTLTGKKVEKQSLFAMVNLSPVPYDTKKAQFQLVPVLLYGVPITGKPLNHHLLAGAIGLNKAQVFAGIMFNHDKDVSGSAPPNTNNSTVTSTGPVRDRWVRKLGYGINFPVSSVVNLLKSAK